MGKGFIFVDVSYLVFYRFFALKTWFSFAHKEIKIKDDEKWLENTLFMEKFEKTLLDTILKIAKKQKIDLTNIIFAFDCHHKDIWRHKIMQEYKSVLQNRDNLNTDYKGLRAAAHEKQNFTEFAIFDIVKKKFLPKFIKEHNNKILKHKEAEADDCIAVGIHYLREIEKDNAPIWIIASDTDYLQICDAKTKLIDLKKKIINEKHLDDKNITKTEYLLNKILLGDVSDNIFACQFLPEMLEKLKEDYNIVIRKNKKNTYKVTNTILKKCVENEEFYKKLKEFMDLDKNNAELCAEFDLPYLNKNQFIYNQKMIDFDYIPDTINEKVCVLMKK